MTQFKSVAAWLAAAVLATAAAADPQPGPSSPDGASSDLMEVPKRGDHAKSVQSTDVLAPTVRELATVTPPLHARDSRQLIWRISFSEAVANIDATDFTVSGVPARIVSVAPVTRTLGSAAPDESGFPRFVASDSQFDVTVLLTDAARQSGSLTLAISPSHDITDLSGNALIGWETVQAGGYIDHFDVSDQDPDGVEFLVNTTSLSTQSDVQMAALAGGGFVAVWSDESVSLSGSSNVVVRAQLFGANGGTSGLEFMVNTTTKGSQESPSVAALTGGGFVVVWEDGSAAGVRAQLFDSNGIRQGGEFFANATMTSFQYNPDVAPLTDGGFVVVWEDFSATGGDTSNTAVRGRRFDSNGVVVGSEFLVNTSDFSAQGDPGVAGLVDGGFVIVWHDLGASANDAAGSSVQLQRYHSSGAASGAQTIVNDTTAALQFNPDVAALDNGGYVVVWQDTSGTGGDTSGAAIRGKRFDVNGSALGSEFLVNTITANSQIIPSVEGLSGGGFTVSWWDASGTQPDDSGWAIRSQYFGPTGNASGSEFLVNSTTGGFQVAPSITGLDDGGFVIAWADSSQTGTDVSSYGIRAQLYVAPDVAAPRIASIQRTAPASERTNSDSVTWRVTFDEVVEGVDVSDFAHTGSTGSLSAVNVSNTVTDVTLSGGDMAGLNGTVTLALAPGVDLADLAGNVLIEPLPLAANETQYLLDNLAPGVTVAFVGTQLSSGAPATTVQFTFSEDVSGFGIDDLTAENGLLSGLQQVSASEYQVTFTANHGVSGNGRVTVGNASYSDLTGNAGAGGTATIAINTVNPVPVISGPVAATNAAFTATISFLEGVTGFDVGDIDAVNASLSDFQTVSGSEYTVLVTPAAEGAVTLDIAANVAADTAGNQNDAAAQYAVTYDATAPDAAITGPAGPVNGMFTATFSFTEDVFGFGSGDVTVGNGAITQFQAVSASVYSATITPTTDGQVTVDVGAGAATDLAGNTSTAAAQFAVANDPTKPSVTISGPAGPVNGSFTATFTFSEPVTGFDAGDVTLANALLSDFQSQSASAYSATITPAADGMVTLDIAADTVTDAASNTNAAANQFAVQADLTAPTVTISGPAGAFSGSFVASFTFAEDVTGFDAGDIAVTNAVLSNFQAQSASAYTATITSAADGPVTIDIAAAAATDGAGNASTAATQFSATNDLTAPTVAITGPVGPVNDVFTATITFSEDVAGFDAGDVTVANGVVSTLQSVSAAVFEVAITPAGDGAVTLDVAANVATDLAGNDNVAAAQFSVTNDQTDPTVTIAGPSGAINAAFVATLTFSEDVTGFEAGDIALSNATLSNFQSVSASEYTALITPSAEGDVTLDIAAGVATDAAGNDNTAATQYAVTSDQTAPDVTISGPSGPVNSSFSVTVSFTEEMTGFESGDVTAVNATLSNLREQSTGVYTLTVSPSAEGAVTLDINAGVATDLAGNGNTVAAQFSLTNDLTAPDITISGPAGPVDGSFTATFTFSEDVSGFDAGDVSVANAILTDFQSVSASVYTATLSSSVDGVIKLNISAGIATDLAGNGNTAAAQYSVTNDPTQPGVTISGPAGPVNAAFTATFTFSEDVSGFAAGDVSVANAALSDFQATSASVYTATITPAADGLVTLDIAGDAAVDSAGNGNILAVQYAVTYDQTAPGVTITGPSGAVNGIFVTTFTFTEDITGFAADDVTIANAALSNFQQVSASVYTATITAASEGLVTLDIAAGAAADLAGNASTAAATYSVTNDPTEPGLTISGPTGFVTSDFTATFTFSEDVSGFAAGDVVAVNATLSDFQSVSASVYTAQVSPSADGLVTLNVPADAATDSAGNGNSAAAQYAVTSDQTAPGTTISGPAGPVNAAFTATITFSETVTGFGSGDIAVSNAALTDFLAVSGSVYTATVTPATDGPVTLDVASAAASDAAGNDNTAAAQFAVTNDQTAPSATISGPTSTVNNPFTATFTFSEDVTGFEIGDISTVNASPSNFTAVSASVYTATITPDEDGDVSVDLLADVATDLAGNANKAASQYTVTYSSAPPSLTIEVSGLGAGEVAADPVGITCTGTCIEQSVSGSLITLTASAGANSSFDGWTAGPCAGTAAETCAITVFENVTVEARFESLNLQAGQVFAATLPGARSGFVGGADVTVFMSVVSRADRPAQACRIFAPEGAPASFAYWELQGTEPVGSVSPRFDLRAGETRNFLLALTPTSETVAEGYTLLPQITCDNATLTPIEGISSVHLSIEAAPPPDLLSISATPTSDGVVNVPSLGNRINIMAVSAINIGIGDGSASTDQATITTSVDSGDVSLPISLEVCETGPSGCITPRGLSTMTTIFEAGVAKTFTVFVRVDETAEVPFSPANNRVFIRFRDANDVLRSVSSAAIRSPLLQASESLSASPAGRWSLLVRQDDEDTPILRRASLFVSETGDALLDDGETVRLIDLATEALPMGGFAISHDGMSGLIAPDGRIELSDALSPNAGAFWGVRDQRDVVPADWPALAGHYSGVTITESGELHGSLDGCAVYGAPGSEGFMQVWLSLCARAGLYQATMDMPMDDSRGPVLVIAGPDAGWRLPQ